MGCGKATMKSLLFCFNVVFCICAVALIALGGVIHWQIKAAGQEVSDHSINTVSIIIIGVGCVAFIIAFLGCWGVVHDSKCMLITYAFFVTLILIVEFACGIFVLMLPADELQESIRKVLEVSLDDYNKGGEGIKTLDGLHETLHCCGVNGKTDFILTSGLPPDSCKCKELLSDDCLVGYYRKSCTDAMGDLLGKLKSSFGVVAICSAIFELLLVLFACLLAHRRHENSFA